MRPDKQPMDFRHPNNNVVSNCSFVINFLGIPILEQFISKHDFYQKRINTRNAFI